MKVKAAAKPKWSAVDRARHKAIRAAFAHRPTQENLRESGAYEGPIKSGAYFAVQSLVRELKDLRAAAGITLVELAKLAGIDEAELKLLETGRKPNPTIDTLWRYADALGRRLVLSHAGTPAKVPLNGKVVKPRTKNP